MKRSSIWRTAALGLGLAAAAAAQTVAVDPEVVVFTEIVVPDEVTRRVWIEVTPLVGETPAAATRLDLTPAEGRPPGAVLRPGLPAGPAMVCAGGPGFGVACDAAYFDPSGQENGVWALEPRFEAGVEAEGAYVLDRVPVAGARVSVVPAGLDAERPYVLPLAWADDESRPGREVTTDDDGRFVLPPLAGGEYFLETLLPSGRVHRGEPFFLPTAAAVRFDTGAEDEERLAWDLGTIEVADGLSVEVRARDELGLPVAGVRVAARQGRTAEDLLSFEAVTGADGLARLSGFDAERPARLACRAPGYAAVERDFELVPAVVFCDLEALAAVGGEVVGLDGLPLRPTRIDLEPRQAPREGAVAAPETGREPPSPRTAGVDGGGRFELAGLVAGEYRLRVGAPGFETVERDLELAPGERLELGTIALLPGDELAGVVVDAESREPIPGALVEVLDPSAPGVRAGADGRFALVRPGDGAVLLRASAPGYAPRELRLPAEGEAPATAAERLGPPLERLLTRPEPPEDDELLTLALGRGGQIAALVTTGGRPCAGCVLRLWPGGGELRTDARGEALSAALAPGWYRVERPRRHHLGSTVVTRPDAEHRLVRVESGRTALVRFAEAASSVRVRFRPAADPAWTLSARTPWGRRQASRAPDGVFLVERDGESLELWLERWNPASNALLEVYQATLPTGFDGDELVLDRRPAAIAGRATRSGRPLAAVPVQLRALDWRIRATARTHPDGRFHFPHLPAGVYAVFVGDHNARFVSLREGESLELGTVELPPG